MMKKRKKIMAFVHWDLDGVVCYQLVRWTFPNADIEYVATTVQTFREAWVKWLSKNNIEDYDTIFIMDLGIGDHVDLVDHKNVFIIDHHKNHNNDTYHKAKRVIKDYSSASKLAFKLFKNLYNIKLSTPKKLLVALADDFDSYTHAVKESSQLNVVFWDTNDKFNSFVKFFGNGFNGFNKEQANMIKLHDIKLDKIRNEIDVYAGKVKLENKNLYVCAAFSKRYINEVADILLQDYNADVALVINLNTDHISFRRGKDCDIDLSKLSEKIADGAGHEYASGGTVTKEFMEFTKQLEKI